MRVRNVLGLGLALLLPRLLAAQTPPGDYQAGTYYLAADRTQPQQGLLRVLNNTLVVANAGAAVRRYPPAELTYVRLADRTRYQSVSSFVAGSKVQTIKPRLVEVLDSGQVMLMVYMQPTAGGPAMGPNGNLSTMGNVQPVFLLQRPSDPLPVALPDAGMSRGGKSFREALLTYVGQRPDLAQLVTDKEIVTDNLPYFIHALNTGRPFTTED